MIETVNFSYEFSKILSDCLLKGVPKKLRAEACRLIGRDIKAILEKRGKQHHEYWMPLSNNRGTLGLVSNDLTCVVDIVDLGESCTLLFNAKFSAVVIFKAEGFDKEDGAVTSKVTIADLYECGKSLAEKIYTTFVLEGLKTISLD